MTPGNIYRYVGSKDDILHLLCQQAYNNTQRLTNAFNENINKDISVIEALRRAVINYLKMSDQQSNAFIFLIGMYRVSLSKIGLSSATHGLSSLVSLKSLSVKE